MWVNDFIEVTIEYMGRWDQDGDHRQGWLGQRIEVQSGSNKEQRYIPAGEEFRGAVIGGGGGWTRTWLEQNHRGS